jgi:hypothetical protein
MSLISIMYHKANLLLYIHTSISSLNEKAGDFLLFNEIRNFLKKSEISAHDMFFTLSSSSSLLEEDEISLVSSAGDLGRSQP